MGGALQLPGPPDLAGSLHQRVLGDASAAGGVSGHLHGMWTKCLAATIDMQATCWDPPLSRQLKHRQVPGLGT